jgi:hypothetical protein
LLIGQALAIVIMQCVKMAVDLTWDLASIGAVFGMGV